MPANVAAADPSDTAALLPDRAVHGASASPNPDPQNPTHRAARQGSHRSPSHETNRIERAMPACTHTLIRRERRAPPRTNLKSGLQLKTGPYFSGRRRPAL